MEVATLLSKRIREAPERKLPYTSWVDVHKVLAADGLVPYGATGMRGTQKAVERLERARVVLSDKEGMAMQLDAAEDEELEQLIFPEEFTREEGHGYPEDQDKE